jgi:hypothetical protein
MGSPSRWRYQLLLLLLLLLPSQVLCPSSRSEHLLPLHRHSLLMLLPSLPPYAVLSSASVDNISANNANDAQENASTDGRGFDSSPPSAPRDLSLVTPNSGSSPGQVYHVVASWLRPQPDNNILQYQVQLLDEQGGVLFDAVLPADTHYIREQRHQFGSNNHNHCLEEMDQRRDQTLRCAFLGKQYLGDHSYALLKHAIKVRARNQHGFGSFAEMDANIPSR